MQSNYFHLPALKMMFIQRQQKRIYTYQCLIYVIPIRKQEWEVVLKSDVPFFLLHIIECVMQLL